MTKLIITLLAMQSILALQLNFCFAQTTFQKSIGGTGADSALYMSKTSDGGFIVGGSTTSYGQGNTDMYILKLDASGSVVWTATIGGTLFDGALCVVQTTDGGYTAAGYTNSFGLGSYDMYIVKLNSSGVVIWSKTIGGSNIEIAESIRQTADGGYIIAGRTNTFGAGDFDMYIVKLDTSGSMQWSRTIGGTNTDEAHELIETNDGKYVIAGMTISYGAGVRDMFVVKLDAGGNQIWSKTLGGTSTDNAWCLTQSLDGGYAIGGSSLSFTLGGSNFNIVKLDTSGVIQWSKTIGTSITISVEIAYSIIQTTDGGYVMAGNISNPADMYIVKLDSNGSFLWNRSVGGSNLESVNSVVQTTDGGIMVAGNTPSFGNGGSDIFIVKLDAGGYACGNSTTPVHVYTNVPSVATTPAPTFTTPSSVLTSPTSLVNSGGSPAMVCNLTGLEPTGNEIPKSCKLYQNFPNPFNPVTNLKFEISLSAGFSAQQMPLTRLVIYNSLGQEIETLINTHLSPGKYEVQWHATQYPSGVYYYTLNIHNSGSMIADYSESRKMLLIK